MPADTPLAKAVHTVEPSAWVEQVTCPVRGHCKVRRQRMGMWGGMKAGVITAIHYRENCFKVHLGSKE